MDFKKFFDRLRLRYYTPRPRHDPAIKERYKIKTDLREDLTIDWQRVIGFGNFSVVHLGSLKDLSNPVAVKVPRDDDKDAQEDIERRIMDEVFVMEHVGHHDNIINLLGIHYINDSLHKFTCLITPLCMNGSLQGYLRSKPIDVRVISEVSEESMESDSDSNNTPSADPPKSQMSVLELARFSHQIALGMEYLTGRNIVHGDLAARNVLLDEGKNCKISDFGMSKRYEQEVEETSVHQGKSSEDATREHRVTPIPWRWTAYECLEGEPTSMWSDIWAFGVTLWEIFTVGDVPYPKLNWDQQFMQDLKSGYLRLKCPKHASQQLYDLMLSCWKSSPTERPSFRDLQESLGKLSSTYASNPVFRQAVEVGKQETSTLYPLVADYQATKQSRDADSRGESRIMRRFSRKKKSSCELLYVNGQQQTTANKLFSANFSYSDPLVGHASGTATTYREFLDGKPVAVKRFQLSSEASHIHAVSDMYNEVKIMTSLNGAVEHPNVLRFIGKFFNTGQERSFLNIIYEYCENGTLEDYLRKTFTSEQTLATTDGQDQGVFRLLCRFSYEIASGMEFIASNHIVHGDVSTRMILLDGNLTCKIKYNSLSRRTYDHYDFVYTKKTQDPLPWKWLSVETLKRLEFSTKTDIWSYGIILWEIFSLGKTPYEDCFNWTAEFADQLLAGLRLPQPEFATLQIYRGMRKCWSNDPSLRPPFSQMASFFQELMNQVVYVELI